MIFDTQRTKTQSSLKMKSKSKPLSFSRFGRSQLFAFKVLEGIKRPKINVKLTYDVKENQDIQRTKDSFRKKAFMYRQRSSGRPKYSKASLQGTIPDPLHP